jgi:hypothetical protein
MNSSARTEIQTDLATLLGQRPSYPQLERPTA